MAPTLFENIVGWIRTGYPEGIPPADYPPLLALMTPMLSESEITDIVLRLAVEYGTDTPATQETIAQAIHAVTEQAPSTEEMKQVATRLSEAGWPIDLDNYVTVVQSEDPR